MDTYPLTFTESLTFIGIPSNTTGLFCYRCADNSAWFSISVLLYVIITFKLCFELDSSISFISAFATSVGVISPDEYFVL